MSIPDAMNRDNLLCYQMHKRSAAPEPGFLCGRSRQTGSTWPMSKGLSRIDLLDHRCWYVHGLGLREHPRVAAQ
jgi:hypothetical protein